MQLRSEGYVFRKLFATNNFDHLHSDSAMGTSQVIRGPKISSLQLPATNKVFGCQSLPFQAWVLLSRVPQRHHLPARGSIQNARFDNLSIHSCGVSVQITIVGVFDHVAAVFLYRCSSDPSCWRIFRYPRRSIPSASKLSTTPSSPSS